MPMARRSAGHANFSNIECRSAVPAATQSGPIVGRREARLRRAGQETSRKRRPGPGTHQASKRERTIRCASD